MAGAAAAARRAAAVQEDLYDSLRRLCVVRRWGEAAALCLDAFVPPPGATGGDSDRQTAERWALNHACVVLQGMEQARQTEELEAQLAAAADSAAEQLRVCEQLTAVAGLGAKAATRARWACVRAACLLRLGRAADSLAVGQLAARLDKRASAPHEAQANAHAALAVAEPWRLDDEMAARRAAYTLARGSPEEDRLRNAFFTTVARKDQMRRQREADSIAGRALLDQGQHDEALVLLQRALTCYPPTASERALLNRIIGSALLEKPSGSRSDNIEAALACFHASDAGVGMLKDPVHWAKTQVFLGAAYSDRMVGDRSANIEAAIQHYQQALELFDYSGPEVDFSESRAATHNNLGAAYRSRLAGDARENMEQAIKHYRTALKDYTREAAPHDWAMTHNNLGVAYQSRLAGSARENKETAIELFNAALQVYTREAAPYDWALTQHNLGAVHLVRVAGDPAENVETAIAHFKAALEVRTREARPLRWAVTQTALGEALLKRQTADPAAALEEAIACLGLVPETLKSADDPRTWALAHKHLASAFLQRARGSDRSPAQRARDRLAAGSLCIGALTDLKDPAEKAVLRAMMQESQKDPAES